MLVISLRHAILTRSGNKRILLSQSHSLHVSFVENCANVSRSIPTAGRIVRVIRLRTRSSKDRKQAAVFPEVKAHVDLHSGKAEIIGPILPRNAFSRAFAKLVISKCFTEPSTVPLSKARIIPLEEDINLRVLALRHLEQAAV
jgi:hypothetical protein